MRECIPIINTLEESEFLILGSKHPTVFSQITNLYFSYSYKNQNQTIEFIDFNLHIVWTAAKQLALPDYI